MGIDRDGEVSVGSKRALLMPWHRNPIRVLNLSVAPKVLMHYDDVESTGVIQPGSRLNWRTTLSALMSSLQPMTNGSSRA